MDKNTDKLSGTDPAKTTEESQAGNLNWLLDIDLSEPEERLFTVDQSAQVDTELTDYELEVARRPMTRGATGADDMETYVDEEIVMSSETRGGDIYASMPSSPSAARAHRQESASEPMAIDYSRRPEMASVTTGGAVSEGADILGLAEDDDIGEKYLTVKKASCEQRSGAAEKQAAECETNTPVAEPSAPVMQAGPQETVDLSSQEPTVEITEQETPDSPMVISEAPVLRLVNPVSPLSVANDEVGAAGDAVAAAAQGEEGSLQASTDNPDVLGYIAAAPPPSDDEAFDNYLLDGGQLDDVEADIHELTLEPMDGEAGYDASIGETIDYHEDFHRLSGVGEQAVASATQLVPQLMEELSGAIAARLVELGLDAGSVQPEVMLGADTSSVEKLVAEGYEPAISICPMGMTALQQLRRGRSRHAVSASCGPELRPALQPAL